MPRLPVPVALLCTALATGCAFQRPYDLLKEGAVDEIEVATAGTLEEFVQCTQVRLEREPYPTVVVAGFVSEVPAIRRITLWDGLELRSMGAQANFIARFHPEPGKVRVVVFSHPWGPQAPYATMVRGIAEACAPARAGHPAT